MLMERNKISWDWICPKTIWDKWYWQCLLQAEQRLQVVTCERNRKGFLMTFIQMPSSDSHPTLWIFWVFDTVIPFSFCGQHIVNLNVFRSWMIGYLSSMWSLWSTSPLGVCRTTSCQFLGTWQAVIQIWCWQNLGFPLFEAHQQLCKLVCTFFITV